MRRSFGYQPKWNDKQICLPICWAENARSNSREKTMLTANLLRLACCSFSMAILLSAGTSMAGEYHNPIGPKASRLDPLNGNFVVGMPFELQEATTISSAGAMFSGLTGSVFIAIVKQSALVFAAPTNSATALPFGTNEALALSIGQGTKPGATSPEELSFPLNANLPPGFYVLILGTGLYGTSGNVLLPRYEPGPSGSSLLWYRWTGWNSYANGAIYDLFISGSTEIRSPVGAAVLEGSAGLGGQLIGARFVVSEPVRVTAVAAELAAASGSFFAAFVPLASLSSLPVGDTQNGVPFNPGEVLAHQTFSANVSTSQVVTVPFSAELAPGVYGLVFGSGLYGTAGSGGMPNYTAAAGSSSFFWSSAPWRWQDAVIPGFSAQAWNISMTVLPQVVPVLGITMTTGVVGVTIRGSAGTHYQLEYASTVPVTNWVTLTNFSLPGSPYLFLDVGSTNDPMRFYRAIGFQ
jgi:hypothetical protein